MLRGVVFVLCAIVIAGCGGGGRRACAAEQARAIARADADIAAIERASARPTHDVLKGDRAVNRATDRFLHDVFTAPLDNLTRNRLIDHAAAAVAGSCTQCFQALEAERPVVTIHYGGATAACASARRAP